MLTTKGKPDAADSSSTKWDTAEALLSPAHCWGSHRAGWGSHRAGESSVGLEELHARERGRNYVVQTLQRGAQAIAGYLRTGYTQGHKSIQ